MGARREFVFVFMRGNANNISFFLLQSTKHPNRDENEDRNTEEAGCEDGWRDKEGEVLGESIDWQFDTRRRGRGRGVICCSLRSD